MATQADIVHLQPRPLTQRSLCRLVLWLLAVVLPLQGTASVAFAALWPAHVHETANAGPMLVDFRRIVPGVRPATHVSFPLVHLHHSAAPQRHHHASADRTVVFTDDEGALHQLEVDEGRGLVASLTGFAEPLERPPKRA